MNTPHENPWREWLINAGNGAVMIIILILLGVSILGVPTLFGALPSGEIQMGMVVVFAIVVLLTFLYLMAAGLSRLGLTNPQQALGLPEGSIRALIALFLIMIFIIVSVYLFRTIAGRAGVALPNLKTEDVAKLQGQVFDIKPNENNSGNFDVTLRVGVTAAGEQLALQIATILGTLVTAVSAFYFGSTTATSAQRSAPAALDSRTPTSAQRSVPAVTSAATSLSVDSIIPASAAATAGPIPTELTGTGFVTGARVKLMQTGVPDIDATNMTTVDVSKITCIFDLKDKQSGQWDVVVINPDGTQATKDKAFQIT